MCRRESPRRTSAPTGQSGRSRRAGGYRRQLWRDRLHITGLRNRIAQGLVDPGTGEGYRGLVGLDFDGDGTADVFTYEVMPNGELPEEAQKNGARATASSTIVDHFFCQV